MRAVLQRVRSASVRAPRLAQENEISAGLLVLLNVHHEDTQDDLDYVLEKILTLRLFDDEKISAEFYSSSSAFSYSLSNHPLEKELLVIPQFTLLGACQKGRRPSFSRSAPFLLAKQWYDKALQALKESHKAKTQGGFFGEEMHIQTILDGPITLILDSHQRNL